MNIVNFDPKELELKKRKEELLEVLAEISQQVEQGKIKEFVACSVDHEGECQIHAVVDDFVGGVGLFEIGKKTFIDQA